MKKGDLSIERKGKHPREDNGERTLMVWLLPYTFEPDL